MKDRILIVEDEEKLREVLCDYFRSKGAEPAEAADGLKALELLGKHLGMFKDKVELSGSLETEKTKLDDLIQQMRGGGG